MQSPSNLCCLRQSSRRLRMFLKAGNIPSVESVLILATLCPSQTNLPQTSVRLTKFACPSGPDVDWLVRYFRWRFHLVRWALTASALIPRNIAAPDGDHKPLELPTSSQPHINIDVTGSEPRQDRCDRAFGNYLNSQVSQGRSPFWNALVTST